MRTTPCRGCGMPMIWTVTAAGKRMPVDAAPHPEGNVVLVEEAGVIHATVVPAGSTGWAELHRSHFATCPKSATFRRGGR